MGGFTLFAWIPATASGHAVLTDPVPRSNEPAGEPFVGGCGDGGVRGVPTVVDAGSTIQVSWTESINHFGRFELQFSSADDSDWVLLRVVEDPQGGATTNWTTSVTLPDELTSTGTLRLSQWASSGSIPPTITELHRSCADLELLAPDTDGDTVRDDVDLCPEVAGTGAANGCPVVSRELTLRFPKRGDVFKGRLSAPESGCVQDQLVSVFKVAAGDDKRLGGTMTKATGRYTLSKRRRPGRFYALAAKTLEPTTGTCSSTSSPIFRIR